MRSAVLIVIGCLWGMSAGALTNTNVVAFALINVAPEKYKNKCVVYTETYHRFMTAFPNYVEASGFKPDKWFLLEVGDPRLPVMCKKKADMTALIATLKPGSKLRVEGRVKEFKVNSRDGRMPNYYLDADVVAFVAAPDVEEAGPMRGGGNAQRRPKRAAQW